MKRFKVEHSSWDKPTIYITLNQPPYENENVLHKTGYKIKDCKITELSNDNTINLQRYKSIDNEYDEKENSLMGLKQPKKKKPFMKKKPKGKK